ncbi:MAG: hypothetical protein ACYSUY_20855 [Planctomycetota bacterium]
MNCISGGYESSYRTVEGRAVKLINAPVDIVQLAELRGRGSFWTN